MEEWIEGATWGEICMERDLMEIGREGFFMVEWTEGCLDGWMDHSVSVRLGCGVDG